MTTTNHTTKFEVALKALRLAGGDIGKAKVLVAAEPGWRISARTWNKAKQTAEGTAPLEDGYAMHH